MSVIHATAIVDPKAEIANNAEIGPFCVIGPDVRLESGVRLHSHVTVSGRTRLGADVEVFSGAVLGAKPQILNAGENPFAALEIGAGTVIREHVTMHLGSNEASGPTQIGNDCYMMIGAHIAHDCLIGDRCVFANNVTFGGHVVVGDDVWIGGMAAIHQHSRIGAHAFVAGGAILVGDVVPFGTVVGNHAELSGVNVVGLRRRGFERARIQTIRTAFKRLFFSTASTFDARLGEVEAEFGDDSDVGDVIAFIKEDRPRALCTARRSA